MAAPLTRRLTRQRNQGAIGRAGVPTTTQENDMATSNQGGDKNKQGSGQGANQGSNQGASKRGFASMDPDQQREIASEGGRAAHEKGTAHEFTSEEARRAGSMSHKNDQGSSQGSGTASRSRSGGGNQGSAGRDKNMDNKDDDTQRGGSGGHTGGSKT